MPIISKNNPIKLSLNVLRYGTTSLQSATTQETTKRLNRVGHFCLNVAASTTVVLTLASFLNSDPDSNKRCDASFLILSVCMWLQLTAARQRTVMPLYVSAILDIIIFGLVVYEIVQSQLFHTFETVATDYIVAGLWLVLIIVRLLATVILYKVLTVKNPQFALSTTVYLKPTNTPVTFSSVLAPQDLDPTNPYHSQTVYNINNPHANPLNKTVA